MKKFVFLFLAFLASAAQTKADDFCCDESWSDCFGFDSVLTFDVGGGYRSDKLNWETFPVTAPGTEIKEKWKNLNMGIVEANAQFLACEHYLLKFDFDYGWFENRNGRQHVTSTFLPTGATLENVNSRTKGRVYDVSGGIGYQFNWFCYRYSFAPLIGYSYHFMKFSNHKYHDELTNTEFFANNNYKYRIRGPWLGFSTAFNITCDWQLYFSYYYHWARLRGKINENFLPGDLPLHQKCNRLSGNEFVVGTTYEFCADWLLGLKFDFKDFSGNKGHISSLGERSPLRKFRWDSWYVTVDIGYVF